MENIALVTVRGVGARSSNNKVMRPSAVSTLSAAPNQTFARCDQPPPGKDASLGVKFISAGTAACIADMATFPLDTAKVRLQIQGEGLASSLVSAASRRTGRAFASAVANNHTYGGLLSTVATISREEGVRALYSGLVPGLQRQMAFASVRIGLYDVVKQGYSNLLQVDPNQKNIGLRMLAGITTGGAAVLVAQPTDVVKVRLQAQCRAAPRYSGCVSAYRTIAIEEGARGLWKGCLPNISRNAVVNCTELVSYDLIKEAILNHALLSDNIPCHCLSAVGAGFITTLCASPIDVVKTRFMNSAPGQYSGALECASKMYREGGVKTFYKGCVPAFLRFGPWNVVMFISYEQLKKFFTSSPSSNRPAQVHSIKSSSSRYM